MLFPPKPKKPKLTKEQMEDALYEIHSVSDTVLPIVNTVSANSGMTVLGSMSPPLTIAAYDGRAAAPLSLPPEVKDMMTEKFGKRARLLVASKKDKQVYYGEVVIGAPQSPPSLKIYGRITEEGIDTNDQHPAVSAVLKATAPWTDENGQEYSIPSKLLQSNTTNNALPLFQNLNEYFNNQPVTHQITSHNKQLFVTDPLTKEQFQKRKEYLALEKTLPGLKATLDAKLEKAGANTRIAVLLDEKKAFKRIFVGEEKFEEEHVKVMGDDKIKRNYRVDFTETLKCNNNKNGFIPCKQGAALTDSKGRFISAKQLIDSLPEKLLTQAEEILPDAMRDALAQFTGGHRPGDMALTVPGQKATGGEIKRG